NNSVNVPIRLIALPEKEVCNQWHNVPQGEYYLLTYFFIDDKIGRVFNIRSTTKHLCRSEQEKK
ncbi:hypothetical protein M0P98_08780, partial [bacterium]|nr:hypothetical protein [bacterium]